MFMTEFEIADLTGYELPAYQCKWLKNNGWIFEKSRTGKPKVLRSFAEQKMLNQAKKNADKMPNIAAIKKAA